MKKILFILFLFIQTAVLAQFRIEYNPKLNRYPTRPNISERISYVGWINPTELSNSGFKIGYDIWEINTVSATNTVIITDANIGTIQTIIDALDTSRINRLFFRATGGLPTTFRNFSVNCKAKHGIQFVGETDAQGNNLITLNGSILLNSWSANSGKFRHAVTNYNALVDRTTDTQDRFQVGYLNTSQQIYFNNIPLIPVADIASVDDNTKFFYDVTGGFVYVNFSPAVNSMEWAQEESAFHCGATAANYVNATNGVVISNFNVVKYAGTSLSGAIGGRGYVYPTGTAYPQGNAVSGWFVKDCVLNLNGGIGIFLHSRSTAYRNKISNTGLISMQTVYPSNELGYTTTVSTSFIENLIENDNWRGMSGDYANGFKVVSQYKVRILNNLVRNQGFAFHNRTPNCDGIWLDFCEGDVNNYSEVIGNIVYNVRQNGLHIECSPHTRVERNVVYDVALNQIAPAPHGALYMSTSGYCIVRNNTFKMREVQPLSDFEVKVVTMMNTNRGNSNFTGLPHVNRDNVLENNTYWCNNRNGVSGITNFEYVNGQTATVPVWQWAINNNNVSRNNIFRGILAGTNFIQTGSSTDNLATFQGRSTNFELGSTIN